MSIPNSTIPTIPIIDLRNDTSEAELGKQLHHALTTTGFFYLKQDIITTTEMEQLLEISNDYFNLPIDTKIKHFNPVLNRGKCSVV